MDASIDKGRLRAAIGPLETLLARLRGERCLGTGIILAHDGLGSPLAAIRSIRSAPGGEAPAIVRNAQRLTRQQRRLKITLQYARNPELTLGVFVATPWRQARELVVKRVEDPAVLVSPHPDEKWILERAVLPALFDAIREVVDPEANFEDAYLRHKDTPEVVLATAVDGIADDRLHRAAELFGEGLEGLFPIADGPAETMKTTVLTLHFVIHQLHQLERVASGEMAPSSLRSLA